MANHKGSEGAVYIGANAIAEINDWSFDEGCQIIDDSTLNDTADTVKAGRTNAKGSISCFWDETDTNGQQAMTIGAEVTLNLYGEGNTSGDTYWTGSVIIESISRGGGKDDMITSTFGWVANGGMTESTVA